MNKISETQKREVLAEVPDVLRKVAGERDFYRTELLKQASRTRVVKLAAAMVEKGLREGDPETVADELEKEAKSGGLDLTVTERAVEILGPNMGKQASIQHDSVSGGTSDLERYLMS